MSTKLETPGSIERRKRVRKICFGLIDHEADGIVRRDFTTNISENGLFLETRTPLPVGDSVTISFPCADADNPISITGQVIRCDTIGTGINFEESFNTHQFRVIVECFNRSVLENAGGDAAQPESDAALAIRNRLRHNRFKEILTRFFGELDEKMLEMLEVHAEWKNIPRGTALYRQGDPADGFCLLINGRLQAVIEDTQGTANVVGDITRGESVGEMAALTGDNRSASVYAARDCQVVQYSGSDFDQIVHQYPQMMKHITKILIDRLRKAINKAPDTGKVSTIAVIPVSSGLDPTDFVNRFVKALSNVGPVLCLDRKNVDKKTGMQNAASTTEDAPYNIILSGWLDEQESLHSLTVYQAEDTYSPWTRRCMRQADCILFLGKFSDDPGTCWQMTNGEEIDQTVLTSNKILVLLHPDGSKKPVHTHRWLEALKLNKHQHVRLDRETDIQRLSRITTGRAVGLVLGGGGARGFAHIGAIKAFQEAGIPIDMIGGTSMGAVIAAQHALEWTHSEKLDQIQSGFIDKNPFKDYTLPIISLLDSRKLDTIMKSAFGDMQIEDLWINYFCISSNLTSAKTVVHHSGLLWKALRASSSLPGILVPVIDNADLLVDGGVLNNLPGDIMRETCGGTVIVVDVSAGSDLTVPLNQFPSPWKILWSRLFPFIKPVKVPDILSILMRTTVLNSIDKTNTLKRDADVYLHLPVGRFNLLDFGELEEIVSAGYRHAKRELKHLKNRILSSASPPV